MPKITVNVNVDIEDVFAEIEDDDLTQEMMDRGLFPTPMDEFDDVINKEEVYQLFKETADFYRAHDKLNLAMRFEVLIEEMSL